MSIKQNLTSAALLLALAVSLFFNIEGNRVREKLLKTIEVQKIHVKTKTVKIPVNVPGLGLAYREETDTDSTLSDAKSSISDTKYGSPFHLGIGAAWSGLEIEPKTTLYGSFDIIGPFSVFASYTPRL